MAAESWWTRTTPAEDDGPPTVPPRSFNVAPATSRHSPNAPDNWRLPIWKRRPRQLVQDASTSLNSFWRAWDWRGIDFGDGSILLATYLSDFPWSLITLTRGNSLKLQKELSAQRVRDCLQQLCRIVNRAIDWFKSRYFFAAFCINTIHANLTHRHFGCFL